MIGSGVIEIMSYDNRLVLRYRGVEPLFGVIVGKVYAQGERIGTTTGYALGVSLRIDKHAKNVLEIYTQTQSQQWFDAWDKKNPGAKAKLIMGENDFYYHYTARELNANDKNSYINPEAYGINPNNVTVKKR